MGCPHIFPTFIHPKKNGNDTAGYDFRLLEIQNPLASNFLTFVENMKDNELLSGNTRWRLSDSRRIVTSNKQKQMVMKRELGFKGERFIYLPLSILEQMEKNPLTGDLYIYSLGYFTKAAFHYIERLNGCDQYLLIYCKDGKGHVRIQDRQYELSADQYIILPPHIYHQYEADEKDPWSIYWFHFKGTKAPYIAQGQGVPHTVTPSVSSRQQNRLELFEEIYTTLKSNLSVEHINYANFCFGYFLSTLLYIQQYRESGGKSEYMGTIINRSIYYMNENINKNLTVQEIASFVNYSPSYFYRKFMQEIGIAPMTYFTKMKINKAYGLLKDTDLKINQIATLLGYTDPLYFSRVFSKEAGVSPQQYRAANKK